jgi:hypothetical protein
MREELLAIQQDVLRLQERLNALLNPNLTEVPSLAQVITWINGKLERL